MPKIILTPVSGEDMDEVLRLPEAKDGYWEALTNLYHTGSENPFIQLLMENGEPTPILSILSIIRRRFNGFGIFEYPYLDVEFWASHSSFYGTCFTTQPRECERLHFFQAREGGPTEGLPQKIVRLLQKGASEEQILNLVEYCGYTVIRPIRSNVVGRTAIKFDDRSTRELQAKGLGALEPMPGRPLLKTSQECCATLLNAHFSLQTPEFIQQDPQLGQCATASLWVAGNIAAKKFGTRQIRFPNITKNAFAEKTPAPPDDINYVDSSSGLYANEIKNALSMAGSAYQAETYCEDENSLRQACRISHFVYSYVESGLPVILCLDPLGDSPLDAGHAVAATGHFLPEGIGTEKLISLHKISGFEAYAYHRLISSAITSYYVHDDCNGPFNRLNLSVELEPAKVRQCASGQKPACIDGDAEDMFVARCQLRNNMPGDFEGNLGAKRQEKDDRGAKKVWDYNLREAIAPVHFRVRLTAWDSLMSAISLHAHSERDEDKGKFIYLWRSFLISGSELKRSLDNRQYPNSIKKQYAGIHMSKYIWVHEYTKTKEEDVASCFPASDESTRMIHGEFIFDATSPRTNMFLITMRVEGALWVPPERMKVYKDWKPVPCFRHSDVRVKSALPPRR